MKTNANDISREGKSGKWIFRGKLLVLPVMAVAAGIAIFKTLMKLDVDWFMALPFACFPMIGVTVFVWLFVNGKPPSYANDLLMLITIRNRMILHQHGWIVEPPKLWIEETKPSHPKEY